jgi:capsular exopolysaccharide synthesis family protein
VNETTREPRDVRKAPSLELRDYLRILRTYWLGSLVILLLAVLAGAGWTLTQPRIYSAMASGLVQAPTGDDPSTAYAADALSKSQAQSYVQLATSLSVANAVAKSMGTGVRPAVLLSRVQATLPDSTAIIEITALGPTPQSASTLANAWVKATATQVTKVQDSGSGISGQTTRFVPLASASVPTAPISPDVKAALLLAGIIGLLIGFVYAIIRNHLDRRVRSAAYIETNFRVSVLGTIPINPLLTEGNQLISNQPNVRTEDRHTNFAMAESLRELRTNLSYVDVDNPPKLIVVTSPRPADGKSTIAANLAEALASSTAQRVIAIDCDLRRPSLSKIFNVADGAGLTDVLSGRAQLGDVTQQVGESSNLWVIGAGRIPPNPSELLGSRSLKEILAFLGEHAIVILDAPPVLPVTDAVVLSNSADGVLVVVSARSTTYDQLDRTLQLVGRGGGKLLGAVLNQVPTRGQDARDYGYYGGSYYQNAEEAAILNAVEADLRGGDSAGVDPSFASPGSSSREGTDAVRADDSALLGRRARRAAVDAAQRSGLSS